MIDLYSRLIRHSGNQNLFRVIEMSVAAIVNERPFHIQAEGPRGTGKTTIMRAARALLPPITRIKDCLYNCHPAVPHCPAHRNLSQEAIAALGVEQVPRPFLEISQAAKLGTVVGSIDLAKLTSPADQLAALLPGTIPRAHRGIIFIDEINRLADTAPELADVLLDVMGTRPGRVQIEEPGLPVAELPVAVSIWAASNPDEDPGPLRRIRKQLSDRFDVAVTMGRPDNFRTVAAILAGQTHETQETEVLSTANLPLSGRLEDIEVSQEVRELLGKIYLEFGLESLRSITAMETAACLTAMLDGRTAAGITDLAQIAPLVLAHRVSPDDLVAIQSYLYTMLYGQDSMAARKKIPPSLMERLCPANLWAAVITRAVILMNKRGGLPGRTGKGAAGEQETARIVDPLNTTIVAPPKPAVPLARLPDEQLVTRSRKPHG